MENPGNEAARIRDIQVALGKVLESGVLGDRSRLKPLLRYLVTEELEGRGEALKAYVIGVDVFGRPDTFDTSADSIVRVEANRLRQALAHYYDTQGAEDALIISIPKGAYRPVFTPGEPPHHEVTEIIQPSASEPEKAVGTGRKAAWMTAAVVLLAAVGGLILWFALPERQLPHMAQDQLGIAVVPFVVSAAGQPSAGLAADVTERVAASLSRTRSLAVVPVRNAGVEPPDPRKIGSEYRVRFIVGGRSSRKASQPASRRV